MQKTIPLMIRLTREQMGDIEEAGKKTGLNRSDVIRQGVKLGLPLLTSRLQNPKRGLGDILAKFGGLDLRPDKSPVRKSRFA